MTNHNEDTCSVCGVRIYKGQRSKGKCPGCNYKAWMEEHKEYSKKYQRKWNRAHGVLTPAEAGKKRRKNPRADVDALLESGKPVKEIAEVLGVSKARVYQIKKKRRDIVKPCE